MMRWVPLACLLALAPAATARAEPLVAVSDDFVVGRAETGPSWAAFGDDAREAEAALHAGAMINRGLAAADLELDVGAGEPIVALHPSVGLKIKILSTPENMGYTYVHAGARFAIAGGSTVVSPVIGARDFITYDLSEPWAFALQWRAQLALDDGTVGGGIAVGIARAEEERSNLAVLIGWKRDRVEIGDATYRADGVTVLVAHQWR